MPSKRNMILLITMFVFLVPTAWATAATVDVTLTAPSDTTVTRGEQLGPFSVSIKNNTSSSYSFYVSPWIYAPDGTWVSLGYIPITLSAGETINANNLYLWVPTFAPTGTHYYLTYMYDTSWNLLDDYDYFTFEVTSTATMDSTPPSTPTGLVATAASSSRIDLSWTASTDNVQVSGYKIYRNGDYITSTSSSSYTETGLTGDTQYCYEVTAYDTSSNESSRSSSVCDYTYTWLVSTSPDDSRIYNISYGKYPDYPQYAALYTSDSYFRMIYSKDATWGTSVILFPVFWLPGETSPRQGTNVNVSWHEDGDNAVLNSSGTLAGLSADIEVCLTPPANNVFTATVNVTTSGSITLANNRPGEAFKPVMLSSMNSVNIGSDYWDTQYAYVGDVQYNLPSSGWIIDPPTTGNVFGLKGGSSWEPNKPTIEISLDRDLEITGWVTASTDYNDDNVGFWAATDSVLSSWQYTITAKQ